ncbi:MAG: hypothetical protein VCE75_28875 [Alphaproteobacteria bacterium]
MYLLTFWLDDHSGKNPSRIGYARFHEDYRNPSRKTRFGTAPTDSASVIGIPEPELTPKVRNAIMTLMQEV